jgi:hypothetical protein
MTPPFFQATIAKSSQSNLHRHKTALRKTATTGNQSLLSRATKKDVCIE